MCCSAWQSVCICLLQSQLAVGVQAPFKWGPTMQPITRPGKLQGTKPLLCYSLVCSVGLANVMLSRQKLMGEDEVILCDVG